jgi:hypothetical protein
VDNAYGSRIRGYLCPPQTGSYTFWISGDDGTELWLSSSDNASAKTRVAYSNSWTGFREWNRYASQKSAALYLEAGKKYYIEALHKEGGGGDHISVAWQLPNGTTEAPIPGHRLSPHMSTNSATSTTSSLPIVNSHAVQLEKVVAKHETKLFAYPNPFSGETVVEVVAGESGLAIVDVCDAAGRIQETLYRGALKKGTIQRLAFRKVNLPGGLYFVRYRSGKFFMVYKLIKK